MVNSNSSVSLVDGKEDFEVLFEVAMALVMMIVKSTTSAIPFTNYSHFAVDYQFVGQIEAIDSDGRVGRHPLLTASLLDYMMRAHPFLAIFGSNVLDLREFSLQRFLRNKN